MFYSESAGSPAPGLACAQPLAEGRKALAEARRTLGLARLRVLAAHHYATCGSGAAAGGPRCRGARRVAPEVLRWHQQMRQLDSRMLAPERSAPLRNAWGLARALADGWVRWLQRPR
ncbi:MAG: hypothetical protein MUF07_11695 [Steroidobacteraceae bacterium]|nr:hypothetical protein [Steroidobacteraceae bacterium]